MKISGKTDIAFFALLCCATLVLCVACGKKGLPTMKSFEKPNKIQEIRAVHRDGKINISWAYSGKQGKIIIKGFRIFKSENKGQYAEIAKLPAEARSYSDSNIKPDTQYRYILGVFTARNIVSDESVELSARPVVPPETPSGLAYRVTNNDVEIVWNKAEEEELFNVYRTNKSGVYPATPVNEKPLVKPFFKDNLNLKEPVFYVIVSVKQSDIPNESGLSSELFIDPMTFVPEPPVDIRYVRSGNRGYLTWKDSDETWVRGYKVYRKGASGSFELLGEVNVPIYLDEDPVSGKTVYYVTAVGPLKESRPSSEVGVRLTAE